MARTVLPPAPADIETIDRNGNTPLLLAYRMGRTRLARMLLAAGAFSKARTPEGFEAIQVAALTANPDMVRESVMAYLAETDAAFARRLPGLQTALSEMPDFTLRMTWEFNSWVPLVSRMLPSDTYYISKRGTSIRLDSTLLGMNGMKWERGSISLLLWGAETPKPGAMYVLDNDMKTIADARLPFTHPQDQHIQDWVRKLLTQKQKTTDFWSRDVVMTPVLRQGLIAGFTKSLGWLAFGDSTPRGRVSHTPTTPSATPTAAASDKPVSDSDEDTDDESLDMRSVRSPTGADTPQLLHVDDPRQVTQDVGVWTNAVVYEMKNFCVRDIVHAPIMPDLKLKSWWKPEYSRQATEEEIKAASDASKGLGVVSPTGVDVSSSSAVGGGAGATATSASAHTEEEVAPEKQLGPLFRALKAIRAGKINEKNASSATLEELEGMGFGEEEGGKKGVVPGGGHTVDVLEFQAYFGFPRAVAGEELTARAAAYAAASSSSSTGASSPSSGVGATAASSSSTSSGEGSEGDALSAALLAAELPPPVLEGGFVHKGKGAVCVFRKEAVTTEDKTLDLKVIFSKEFPIEVRHRCSESVV